MTKHQKKIVAAGRALGKPRAVIAKEADLAPATVSSVANHDPETRTLIEQYKARHEAELYELFRRALAGMKQDLESEEPDIRVRTRDQVFRAVQAGDKTAAAVQVNQASQGDYTMEELMIAYRRVTGGRNERRGD